METWKKLILAWFVFIIVDLPWLTFSGKYWKEIGGGPAEVFPAAIFAYIALAVAVVLVGIPLGDKYPDNPVLVPGLLIGFGVYFCFDMTNRVIFGKKYHWWLAISDTLWGMFASTMTLWVVRKLTD
jgi:uncharacterized membrane protein